MNNKIKCTQDKGQKFNMPLQSAIIKCKQMKKMKPMQKRHILQGTGTYYCSTGLQIFGQKHQPVNTFWFQRRPKAGHYVSPSAEDPLGRGTCCRYAQIFFGQLWQSGVDSLMFPPPVQWVLLTIKVSTLQVGLKLRGYSLVRRMSWAGSLSDLEEAPQGLLFLGCAGCILCPVCSPTITWALLLEKCMVNKIWITNSNEIDIHIQNVDYSTLITFSTFQST